MSRAVVLLTRDLRTHDNPALAAAATFDEVVPLVVLADRPIASPNRGAFLIESLADLRASLEGALVVRHGDPVAAIASLSPDRVFVAADVDPEASTLRTRLRERFPVEITPGPWIVPPGELAPTGRDHYRVFTPYWNAWSRTAVRPVAPGVGAIELPAGIDPGEIPGAADIAPDSPSPRRARGGETEARRLLTSWIDEGLARYGDQRHELTPGATSGLSAHLRAGTLSAVELAAQAAGRPGSEPFLRQLCWRDFYFQLLARNPTLGIADYRPRGDAWADDPDALDAWREGRTGYPIVDAAMRQLLAEGWMPGRARLLAASFLVKDLRIDWRAGLAHFDRWLLDGDLASNAGNWQWVAGTGTDTRPNRVFNPLRQAERFDPGGDYVRRWIPELSSLDAKAIHRPWTIGAEHLRTLGYPLPLVDHDTAAARFLEERTNALRLFD